LCSLTLAIKGADRSFKSLKNEFEIFISDT